jgi:hypothetical protein
MADRYARVVAFVNRDPWAILPESLETIREVLALRAAGERLSEAEIQARMGALPTANRRTARPPARSASCRCSASSRTG